MHCPSCQLRTSSPTLIAQSPSGTYDGAYTGTIGDIGIFSLNFHKVIHCGEGGLLVTNNDQYAFRAQLMRNHGEVIMDDLATQGVSEDIIGSNYRMSELHAAIAIEQLKKLNRLTDERRATAAYLTERLQEISWIIPCHVPNNVKHVYYIYPFRMLEEKLGVSRKTVVAALKAEGFPIAAGFQKPLYLFPMYQKKKMFPHSQFPFVSTEYPSHVSYEKGICPVAERMYEKEICHTVIFQPPNGKAEVDGLIDTLKRIEQNVDALKEYEASAS